MNRAYGNLRHLAFLFAPIAVLITFLTIQTIFVPTVQGAEPEAVTNESTNVQPSAAHALYMPMLQQGKAGVTPVVTPPTKVPPVVTTKPTTEPTITPTVVPTPERLGEALFVESEWQANSSALVVDANGGMHLAYVYHEPLHNPDPAGDSNPTAAVYAYCETACEAVANWQRVLLGEDMGEIQIALTPAGNPRLLLLTRSQQAGSEADSYIYAACDENCTDPSQWSSGTVVTVPNNLSWNPDPDFNDRTTEPRRYFALDPQGQPRFIYYHYNVDVDPDGIGAYYATCDSDCSEPSAWIHTRITRAYDSFGTLYWEEMHNPALTFTSDGRPRVVTFLLTAGILPVMAIFYYECDVACDSGGDGTANWQSLLLAIVPSAGPSDWDIELDENEQPRIALHLSPAPQNGDSLQYGWCNSDCLADGSWQWVGLGLGSYQGRAPDLELNAQGQPRIVYVSEDYSSEESAYGSLFYGWCDTNCQSAGGQ